MTDESLGAVWPQVGQLVQLHGSEHGEVHGPLGIVVKHVSGRPPIVLTQRGPVIASGTKFNRDACVVDLIGAFDQLVLPTKIMVHVICTKRRLISCRAGVWSANRCKTAKLTEINAQEDAETDEPEAAIYLAWTLFSMRFARFAKKHGITYAVPEARVEVGRKPLAAGKLNWGDVGYRKASSWFERTNDKLLHRSVEEILAAGKSIVESKAIGLVTQNA